MSTPDLPVRWVSADALHITLKFLGNVSEDVEPAVRTALRAGAAGASSFDVAIGSFGAFPSLSRPNILWVGVSSAPLVELQQKMDSAYAPIGFAPEARAYHPHITVARVQKHAQLRDRALMDRIAGDFDYKTVFRAVSADLMRSHSSPRGARYELVERVELH